MDRLTSGVTAAAAALSADGGADAAGAIMTTDTVSKQVLVTRDGWTVGGMAKGAGMLAPALATMLVVLTTDAVADAGHAGRGAAVRHGDDVRPDRLRRLHVDQRHGAAAGLRRLRRHARPRRAGRRRHRGLRATWPGSSSPTPRVPPTTSRSRCASAADGPRRARGRPRDRPQQPVQVRGLRRRPQLGPGPRRGRHHRARPSSPPSLDVSINGVQVCRAGGRGGGPLPRRPRPAARCTWSWTCTPATRTATVWTNDLTHDYVHENSAYST